jgi:flavin reductase (DIM6/NTAB) family NADH-FMN oxidoreductase RutF
MDGGAAEKMAEVILSTAAKLRAMTAALPATLHALDLRHAYRLLNTGTSVLIATAHAGRRNLMACAWNMALDFTPAKLAVCIDKATATRPLLEGSGVFAVGVPRAGQAEMVFRVGSMSARDVPGQDKFTAFDIAYFPATRIDVPLVADCIGWLECRLIPEPPVQQAHDLFVGEVLAAWADERAFADGKFRPLHDTPPDWRTLHHLGAGNFVVPGQQLQARR